MTRPLSIHESAEAEINEAADFYDIESPGLGTVFIDEVEKTIEFISRFPKSSPLIRGRIRSKPLLKFPYSLLYSIRPDEIRILAVAGIGRGKQRPYAIPNRLSSTRQQICAGKMTGFGADKLLPIPSIKTRLILP